MSIEFKVKLTSWQQHASWSLKETKVKNYVCIFVHIDELINEEINELLRAIRV